MDMETYAKCIMNDLDEALKMVEFCNENDVESGREMCTPNKFSRGYALGYAHALSNAYETLPDWVRDKI